MTKFCVDCKHCLSSINGRPLSCHKFVCLRDARRVTTLTDGKMRWIDPTGFCSSERAYGGDCGEDARYFEEKPSLWRSIKAITLNSAAYVLMHFNCVKVMK